MLEISTLVSARLLDCIKVKLKDSNMSVPILIKPPDYVTLPMIYIKLEEYRRKKLPLLNYYEVKICVEISVKPDEYNKACYIEVQVHEAIENLHFDNLHIILLNNEKVISLQGNKPQHLSHNLYYNLILQEL